MKKLINRGVIPYVLISFIVSFFKPWFRVELLGRSKIFFLGKSILDLEILDYSLYIKLFIAFLLLYFLVMYSYGILSILRVIRRNDDYRSLKIFLRLSSFLYGLTIVSKLLSLLNDKFEIYRDVKFSIEISSWVGLFFIVSILVLFILEMAPKGPFSEKKEIPEDSEEELYYICRGCDCVLRTYDRNRHSEHCIEFES